MLKRKLKENYDQQSPINKFRRNLIGLRVYLLVSVLGFFFYFTDSKFLGLGVLFIGGLGVLILSVTAVFNYRKNKREVA
jgi:hypothetical protein